jgi:hypothetical protein
MRRLLPAVTAILDRCIHHHLTQVREVTNSMHKFALSLLLACSPAALAQLPGRATWNATLEPVSQEGILTVDLSAQIESGWHVYALSQPAGGPIPLRITTEPGAPYALSGAIAVTKPQRHHDKSFDLDTEFYTDSFHLQVPVKASAAVSSVPLVVRFQMCSDTTCMPPKTIHLTASLSSPSNAK